MMMSKSAWRKGTLPTLPLLRERRVGDLLEVRDQRLLHREDRVGLDVLAVGHEDVRGQRAVPGRGRR